ncbi:hypothetical protein PEC301877_12340 [Pectobacterium carotovorum subsp. carotovorum]|nr:hypothetical protein PEC301877_12340 [Pectobacterium carotovorum subsp. carotovorum]GKX43901.1 hypothetical protein SOASR015_29350 [Pectobacterium carotovorum subsp. carotovorum]
MCNGQSFNKNVYPKLALAYPSGTLPDLRSEFIRGWDNGRGVDVGRVLLSSQAAMLESHNHMLPISDPDLWSGAVYGYAIKQPSLRVEDIQGSHVSTSRELTSEFGGNETRPRNTAFNYIVKAA